MPTFYEFFSGGGMARAGLGTDWTCVLANDFDPVKGEAYRANWGAGDLFVTDIANLESSDLVAEADLAWASSPCQDLSAAGKKQGLGVAADELTTRSGAFWHFIRLIRALRQEQRAPKLLVLENVCGTITSNQGQDFTAMIAAFVGEGYRVGALVMDAALFVPQSRKRVFIVGVRDEVALPGRLFHFQPSPLWHPAALQRAYWALPPALRQQWLWWHLPTPPPRTQHFIDILEAEPTGVGWHSAADTARLLSLMSPVHAAKVAHASRAGHRVVGGVYRRMRADLAGQKFQRAEVRFDTVAGCLRTGSGGSSKQLLLVVEGELKRSRLLSPREAARLMGLPDTYQLPAAYGDAYHLAGDGVVVPVVRYLATHLLEPVLAATHLPSPPVPHVAYN